MKISYPWKHSILHQELNNFVKIGIILQIIEGLELDQIITQETLFSVKLINMSRNKYHNLLNLDFLLKKCQYN